MAVGEVDEGPREAEGRGWMKAGGVDGASEADSVDDSTGSSTDDPMPLVSPSVSARWGICGGEGEML